MIRSHKCLSKGGAVKVPPFYFRAMRSWCTLLLLAFVGMPLLAAGPFQGKQSLPNSVQEVMTSDSVAIMHKEPKRAVAAILAVTLGPFGAHRLYLGTSPKVPVAYALTFGAFGILPLIDLGHILFTPDLERYSNDGRLLMWAEQEKSAE